MIHPIRSNASAFLILDSELAAAVSTEGEFVQIPLKVLFAAVLVDAHHTALEDGTLQRARVACGVSRQASKYDRHQTLRIRIRLSG